VFGGLSFLGWQAYASYGRPAALAAGLIGLAVCLLVVVVLVMQFCLKSNLAYCPNCGDSDTEVVPDDITELQYPAGDIGKIGIIVCLRCRPCNKLFWRTK
jgi:hypothetical protein